MDPETEFQKTKNETDSHIQNLCMYLESTREGKFAYEELPQYAPSDYKILRDGKVAYFVEVKVRSHDYGFYDQEKVPISKYCFGYTFEHKYGVRCLLLVAWADARAGIIRLQDPDRITAMIARHDRGDDKDLYAFYDYDKFKLLNI